MAINSKLYTTYVETYKPALFKELGLKSIMQTPKINKIVINIGLGKAATDKSLIKDAIGELTRITGQVAVPTYAKKSQAAFKIRQGMPIGVKVTLRGQKMYSFLEKLIWISLPHIRDFRGISSKSFDGRGNYSMGLKELDLFPEIDLDKIKSQKGMDITIITSTNDNAHALELLKKMGMPFKGMNGDNN